MTPVVSHRYTAIDTSASIHTSAFAPPPPPNHHEPLKVAEDTYLIRQLQGEGEAPLLAYINSLVVLGSQPTIIDTGTMSNRRQWLDDVFSLVDPRDVRWVFISHDDHDHVGNLAQVMALCTNATLVSSWFQVERLAGDLRLPLNRMRWLGDGESLVAGDRVFEAIRPPVYDSPTTRGLYDWKAGVYWAADCFATAVSGPVDDVSELHQLEWRHGFTLFNLAGSPWLELVDEAKFQQTVRRLNRLKIEAIASAHSPAIVGSTYVGSAIDMLYDLPGQPMPQLPGQVELEKLLEATGARPQSSRENDRALAA